MDDDAKGNENLQETSNSVEVAVVVGKKRAAATAAVASMAAGSNKKRHDDLGRGSKGDPKAISEKLATLSKNLDQLKKMRGRASLTPAQKVDILHVYHQLQHDALRDQQKSGGKKVACNYQQRVSELLGYSTTTISNTYIEWRQNQTVQESGSKGNFQAKAQRIPATKLVLYRVREFIRQERAQNKAVSAKDVMYRLKELGLLNIDTTNGRLVLAAWRAVQRYLQRHGFRRGAKKGARSVQESQHLRDLRTKYLATLANNEALPPAEQRRLVDLDESYIRQQPDGKGDRLCFLAAIWNDDPRVPEEKRADADRAGLIPGTFGCFQAESKVAQQSKDYHKSFDGKKFSNWFIHTLLPAIRGRPCMIRMDNAAFHFAMSSSNPDPAKLKQADLERLLHEAGVHFSQHDSVPKLRLLFREQVVSKYKPTVIAAAESEGHIVLPTVPYHSDLRPIGMLWAQVKFAVRCGSQTTTAQMESRLKTQFDTLLGEGHRVARVYMHVRRRST